MAGLSELSDNIVESDESRFVGLVSLFCRSACAERFFSIDGTVVDSETGLAIPRARIEINCHATGVHGLEGMARREVMTDASGSFFVSGFSAAAGESPVINLIAGHDVGSVSGFVMEGAHPLEGVLAVLIPEDPAALRQHHYAFQTESDGSFEWDYVPVGRYLLFAVDDTTLEYQDSGIVEPYRGKAKLVVVEPNSKVIEQQLALTAPTK